MALSDGDGSPYVNLASEEEAPLQRSMDLVACSMECIPHCRLHISKDWKSFNITDNVACAPALAAAACGVCIVAYSMRGRVVPPVLPATYDASSDLQDLSPRATSSSFVPRTRRGRSSFNAQGLAPNAEATNEEDVAHALFEKLTSILLPFEAMNDEHYVFYQPANESDGLHAQHRGVEFFCHPLEGAERVLMRTHVDHAGKYESAHFKRKALNIYDKMVRWLHKDDGVDEQQLAKAKSDLKNLVEDLEGFEFARPDPENDLGGHCSYVVGLGVITKTEPPYAIGWLENHVVWT